MIEPNHNPIMKRLHHLNLSIVCLVLSIFCMIIGLFGYRQNLTTAYAKEQAILTADTAGDPTQTAVQDLREYSTHHMHADVTFTLDKAYNRDVLAAHAKAATAQVGSINNDLYTTAQASCGERTDSITKANCVINYIHAHQPAESQLAAKPEELPVIADYTYTFTSPGWSWDFAGIIIGLGSISLVASIVLALRSHKPKH